MSLSKIAARARPLLSLAPACALWACTPPLTEREPSVYDTRLATSQAVDQFVALNPCDNPAYQAEIPDSVSVYLTGDPVLENEVHDCQRLVVENARSGQLEFGPLVGLFPMTPAMALSRLAFRDTVVVASLYNWGGFGGEALSYGPLGIGPGWQCLWLHNVGNAAGGWSAAIVERQTEHCGTDPPPSGTAFNLVVQEWEHARLPGEEAYPPTARWGWDEATGTHHAGHKCGVAWCVVRPEEAASLAPPPLSGDIKRSIPGWFDEQRLAIPVSRWKFWSKRRVRPGPVGTFYPVPDLEALSGSDWPTPVKVGDIVVQGPRDADGVGHYVGKFNLQPDVRSASGELLMEVTGMQGRAWYAHPGDANRVPSLALTVTERVLHASPGSVRWRWRDTDETPWAPCRAGCCHGEGTA